MPKRIPVQSVHVVRDGKMMRPALNKPFDFTDAELKDFAAMNPDAVVTIGDNDVLMTSNESQAGELILSPSGTTRVQADASAAEDKPVVVAKTAKKSDADKDL